MTPDYRRKVAVLGTAPSTLSDAPYDDPTWEIWGSGRTYPEVKRWDRWFELHDLGTLGPEWDDHHQYLGRVAGPVYVQTETQVFPNGVVYPKGDIVKEFNTHFLTSTAAFMMALALHEGVDVLGLWGIDMATHGEYAHQRAGCLHFIEIARCKGIDVVVAPGSDLLRPTRLYAFNDETEFTRTMRRRRQMIECHIESAEAQRRALELECSFLKGKLEAFQYLEDNWTEDS